MHACFAISFVVPTTSNALMCASPFAQQHKWVCQGPDKIALKKDCQSISPKLSRAAEIHDDSSPSKQMLITDRYWASGSAKFTALRSAIGPLIKQLELSPCIRSDSSENLPWPSLQTHDGFTLCKKDEGLTLFWMFLSKRLAWFCKEEGGAHHSTYKCCPFL